MKYIFQFYLWLAMLLPLAAISQAEPITDQQKAIDEKAQLIKKYFNQKQIDSMYMLMAPTFTAKVSKQALEQGIVTQLAPYGIITEYTFLSNKNGISKYRTKMLAGLMLQTLIGIDSNGLVSTFAMQPYKDDAAPKRTTLYTDNPMTSKLDSVVDRASRSYMMDSATACMSIALHVNGIDYYYNYGESDKSTDEKASTGTVYEIGSITKTFVGFLLAKAIVERKVALSDPITKYLPDSLAANPGIQKIQLVHLANHTSGLPRLPVDLYNTPGLKNDDPYAHFNENMLMKGLSQIKPTKGPGEQYEYSNYAFGILGTILERIYKLPFPQLIEKYICVPLKLHNTTAANEILPKQAKGYNEKGAPASYWNFQALAAIGSIKSNASDLLSYGKTMMKTFNEKNPISMLLTTPTWNHPPNIVSLAWHQTPADRNEPMVIQHGGGTYGFRSQLSICPEKKWVVIALANHGADPGASGVAMQILSQLKTLEAGK